MTELYRLSVWVFSSFVNSFLLDNFRLMYQGMFPDCEIQLSGGDTQHILERLEAGTLDCALLPMPIDRDRWDATAAGGAASSKPVITAAKVTAEAAQETAAFSRQAASRMSTCACVLRGSSERIQMTSDECATSRTGIEVISRHRVLLVINPTMAVSIASSRGPCRKGL